MSGGSDEPSKASEDVSGQRTALVYLAVALLMGFGMLAVGVGAIGLGDEGAVSSLDLSTDDDPESAVGGADDANEAEESSDPGSEDRADGSPDDHTVTDAGDANDDAGEKVLSGDDEDAGEPRGDADETASEEHQADDTAGDENGDVAGEEADDDDGGGHGDATGEEADDNDGDEDAGGGDDEADEGNENETDDSSHTDQEIEEMFNESVSDHVNVTDLETAEVHSAYNQTSLEYETDTENRSQLTAETRPIAVAFAEGVERGWQTDELWADFVAEESDVYGYFIVDREWAEDWMDGEMSDEEFFQRVEETLITFPLMSDGE